MSVTSATSPETPTGATPAPAAERARLIGSEAALLVALALFCLVPFLGRPFNVDDPLFVWTAKQILKHPTDFYGFDVNWYGFVFPMSVTTKNPPLASYYIASVASVFGFSELALHAAFLLPNVAVVLGTYSLARRMSNRPATAAAIAFLTPAVMVSATTLMCDTMMLAFWVWAIDTWLRGLDSRRWGWFLLAGLLISAAALTKYFGVCLLPLLLAYSLVSERRAGIWLAGFVLPAVALVAYELYTRELYGAGLLLDASSYAQERHGQFTLGGLQLALGLTFLGGALATLLCYAPLVWPRWITAAGFLGAVALAGLFCTRSELFGYARKPDLPYWHVPLHAGVFVVAAVQVVALVAIDLYRRRDKTSLLLAMWVLGTFGFAVFFNWTVNVRSVLPAAPAVGILIARQLDFRRMAWLDREPARIAWFAVPAALISLAVTWGDYRHAQSARLAAELMVEQYGGGATLFFEGHWGFQYYMEELGARCLNFGNDTLLPSQILIVPQNNSNAPQILPAETADVLARGDSHASRWVTDLYTDVGVSFYIGNKGVPLPYAFMRVPPERYYVFRLKRRVNLSQHPTLGDRPPRKTKSNKPRND